MIAMGVVLLTMRNGYGVIILVLCVSMVAYGIKSLTNYFTMSRHMVGGNMMLFIGILAIDAGLFTVTLSNIPHIFVILYLIGGNIFEGVIGILRAFEEKRMEAPSWQLKLGTGIISIVLSAAAFVLGAIVRSADIMVYVYCAGLFYSAIVRIASSFRKTAVVYIRP